MHRNQFLGLFFSLLIVTGLAGQQPPAAAFEPTAPGPVSGAIALPADYTFTPLPAGRTPRTSTAGLKAVAIVGDVGDSTTRYIDDMNGAVTALESNGVTVSRFYYGESSFGWADIVAAAQGAYFLLYMGHGVYDGNMPPNWVGGFYLGGSQFVSPDQIRTDLNGVMAEESVVIFSHACFTAGNAGGDPPDLSQNEAERRVRMYAEPFVAIGMQAYYANNYYNSAARTVYRLLEDYDLGTTFKDGIGYDPADLVQLGHATPGYDLWLDGEIGSWHLAFVGKPEHVLALYPTLGNLPDRVHFSYSMLDQVLYPPHVQITPANIGNDEPLEWQLEPNGAWFTTSPLQGSTPNAFQIAPANFVTNTVASYSGTLTVTVTSPATVANSPHPIAVTLDVFEGSLNQVFLPLISR